MSTHHKVRVNFISVRMAVFLFLAASAWLLLEACNKDEKIPDNPYDTIDRGDTTINGIPLDSNSFAYVHKKVLLAKCALPGCHVGNFEPDFRSVQSSYSTLVYHPIIKNNRDSTFEYRVVPFDTTHSLLYERITNCCFVNTNDRMPQDDIGVALPDADIACIARWIMSGARDVNGNLPRFPNLEPNIVGYAAYNTSFTTNLSNTRLGGVVYNPFVIPASTNSFYVGVLVNDDSTAVNQLQFNKLKISTNADNFSSAVTLNATYYLLGTTQAWVATVNTASLPQNDTLYMRYYVNDGSRPTNTEFPRNDLPYVYKTYWSFIIQ